MGNLLPLHTTFHPTKNPVLEGFFRSYPKWHILKFLVDHKLNRLLSLGVFKLGYWVWFKPMNRVRLVDTKNLVARQPGYSGEPFLIVENHSLNADVFMHYCIWGHLNHMTFTFTTEGSFTPYYPISAIPVHLIEMIPRYGPGQSSVDRMVRRLLGGDIVNIFPAGTYPGGPYANSGLVQEGYSGAARVAYEYWKKTGKSLKIQPVCSIGGNIAYPPRPWALKEKRRINNQIVVKFGKPFTLEFPKVADYKLFKEYTTKISLEIAAIWGQKQLIPNWQKEYFKKQGLSGKPRVHTEKKHKKHGGLRKRKKMKKSSHKHEKTLGCKSA